MVGICLWKYAKSTSGTIVFTDIFRLFYCEISVRLFIFTFFGISHIIQKQENEICRKQMSK